jgi:hypothetical protein
MTAPTEIVIPLDRKTRALRSGDRWATQRLQPDGRWDTLETWTGGRRSLFHWMERNDVTPSREAEAQLAQVPESTGFRDRM